MRKLPASNTNVNPEFDNKPREIDNNVSESTPGIATQSTPGIVTQSTPGTTTQSTDSNEKPKQTPTEYVHELESTEPHHSYETMGINLLW